MTKKNLVAVLLYALAILGPLAALIARFGLDTTIVRQSSPEAVTQLLSVVAAVVAAFVVSIVAGRLLTGGEENPLQSLAMTILRSMRDPHHLR
jgi:hypothetical protein